MRVKIKLEDYLKTAGTGDTDKEKQAREFEKMVETALRNAVRSRKNTAEGGGTEKSDDDGGKIVENEKKTQLETDLGDMKKEYDGNKKFTFGDTTIKKFTPKEFDGKTDEEISAEANEKYAAGAEREKRELERKSLKAADKLEKSLPDVDDAKEKAIDKLVKELENDYEQIKNSAVKRGLGRSSVLSGQTEALTNGFYEDKAETERSAADKKQKIADEIADIKDELYYAIKNLDEETAEKIANEVRSLTEKRDAEKKKVDEYNKEQEEKYLEKIEESEQNGVKFDEKLTDEYAEYYGNKFRRILRYYKEFGSDAVKEAEKDKDFIVSHLDEEGYKNLLRYL